MNQEYFYLFRLLFFGSKFENHGKGIAATVNPTFGTDGQSCFEPVATSANKVSDALSHMVKNCDGGCYSLIYSIQCEFL